MHSMGTGMYAQYGDMHACTVWGHACMHSMGICIVHSRSINICIGVLYIIVPGTAHSSEDPENFLGQTGSL